MPEQKNKLFTFLVNNFEDVLSELRLSEEYLKNSEVIDLKLYLEKIQLEIQHCNNK